MSLPLAQDGARAGAWAGALQLLRGSTFLTPRSSFGVHLYFWTVSSAAADARARAELAAHLQGCLPAGEAQALAVRVPLRPLPQKPPRGPPAPLPPRRGALRRPRAARARVSGHEATGHEASAKPARSLTLGRVRTRPQVLGSPPGLDPLDWSQAPRGARARAHAALAAWAAQGRFRARPSVVSWTASIRSVRSPAPAAAAGQRHGRPPCAGLPLTRPSLILVKTLPPTRSMVRCRGGAGQSRSARARGRGSRRWPGGPGRTRRSARRRGWRRAGPWGSQRSSYALAQTLWRCCCAQSGRA